MIAQLTGSIITANPPNIVLNVNNVGYDILCPLNTFYELNTKQHTLYTQLIIRDDSHTLYGFNTIDEKTVFNTLIKVNGVGPKVALAILSTLSISDIIDCITNDDTAILAKTPGIGNKTAQKIIVELKDRLPKLNLNIKQKLSNISLVNTQNSRQAETALRSLGFKTKEVQNMLSNINTTTLSVREIIKLALKNK